MRVEIFGTFLLLIGTALALTSDHEDLPSIDGMQGIALNCDSKDKLSVVREFVGVPGFDFLKIPSTGEDVRVLVTADQLPQFKVALDAHRVNYDVFVEDVRSIIEADFAQNKRRALLRSRRLREYEGFDGKHFPDYDKEIVSYLKYYTSQYSNVASLFSMGKTSENRDIYGVKISSGPSASGAPKPAVFIDAGIHAREWIAPTTALYAIFQLTANATNNKNIFQDVDIYIVPVLNPDGYQFTHSAATNRLWRKTRSRNIGSTCRGADANRNFGFEWMTAGASQNPCSDIYAGKAPFSEPEAQALQNFIEERRGTIKVYLTLHSYGQYFLHPWGYTNDLPDNEPLLRCVGTKAARALTKVRGTRYQLGSSTNLLYAASGGSDDWAMARGGADISFTIELPGGRYGFAPLANQILPVGLETFQAIKVFAKYAEGKITCSKL